MATELQEYMTFFAEYPRELDALLEGLTPAALNWRPLETGDQDVTNSLAVLVTHAAGSMEDWVVQPAPGPHAAHAPVVGSALAALARLRRSLSPPPGR